MSKATASGVLPLTALYDRAAPDNLLIGLEEVRNRGMIDLRGLANNRKFMAAAKETLGVALPRKPRTSASKGEISILWLSVDQWLILCPLKDVSALLAKLVKALEGVHSLAIDMSDARSILRLTGKHVRHVLMKGSSVDFTQSEFGKGAVRRIAFAEIAALVHVVDARTNVFDLYTFRSQAHHAWDFLVATAGEGSDIGLPGNVDVPETI
ncbi:MAG: sarcosine oxidase subunit gamma [Hyphomicrobiales bacterium]